MNNRHIIELSMQKVTREQWIEGLKGLRLSSAFPKGHFGPSSIKITIMADDNPVAKFHDDTKRIEILTTGDGYLNDVKDCLERAGAIPILVQFSPATRFGGRTISGGKDTIDLHSLPPQKSTDDSNFSKWMEDIIGKIANEAHLIPDTNFIMHHYYSVLKKVLDKDTFHKMKFAIPRLVLLEIENIYNREPQRDQKERQRRLAFNSMREILLMRNEGATLLPPLPSELFDDFSKVAGKGFADPLIRMEVGTYMHYMSKKDVAVIFLTRDLMGSMMATAENIHSIYMVKNDNDEYYLSDLQLADFIIDMAVIFGSCMIRTETQDTTGNQQVEGVWSGKTINEWLSGTLNISA